MSSNFWIDEQESVKVMDVLNTLLNECKSEDAILKIKAGLLMSMVNELESLRQIERERALNDRVYGSFE